MKRILGFLIGLLLTTQLCPAQTDQSSGQQFFNKSYEQNNGGLNTAPSPFALKDTESPNCQNVYFGVDGGIIKRKGFDVLDTAPDGAATVTGDYQYTMADGTTFLIETVSDEVNVSDSLSTIDWTDLTGGATITPGHLFSFATLADLVVMTNGEDVPLSWDGDDAAVSAAGVPTDVTKVKWITTFQNYMFYGNCATAVTTYGSRIYWSNLADPATWTATDFIDVNKNDGEQITGLAVIGIC